MREHATARANIDNVLEQALDVERCVLALWRIRLGLDPVLDAEKEGEGT